METLKIGDFVKCPVGIGCPPQFGYIRDEAILKAFNTPVWIVQVGPETQVAYPKDAPLYKPVFVD